MRRSLANRSTDGASGTNSRASRVSWARVSSSSSRSIRCIADWTKKQIPGQERGPLIYEDLRAPAPAAALTLGKLTDSGVTGFFISLAGHAGGREGASEMFLASRA